jgi:nicotinamide mononucleotide (NMN) deamidase PncC
LEQDGKPVGTVFIAVAGARGVQVWEEHFEGDRAAIRAKTVESALSHIREYFTK